MPSTNYVAAHCFERLIMDDKLLTVIEEREREIAQQLARMERMRETAREEAQKEREAREELERQERERQADELRKARAERELREKEDAARAEQKRREAEWNWLCKAEDKSRLTLYLESVRAISMPRVDSKDAMAITESLQNAFSVAASDIERLGQ